MLYYTSNSRIHSLLTNITWVPSDCLLYYVPVPIIPLHPWGIPSLLHTGSLSRPFSAHLHIYIIYKHIPSFTCIFCLIIFLKWTKFYSTLRFLSFFFFNFLRIHHKSSWHFCCNKNGIKKKKKKQRLSSAQLEALLCLSRSTDLLLHNLSKV